MLKQSSSAQTVLPSHSSVVVIGGGVMGCSTLYHLTQAGVSDAILLERNQLTSGTTWHSAAQVRALRSSYNLTELIRYSINLYSKLEAETGQSVGWINKGSLSLACNDNRLIHIRRQEALAQLYGVCAQSISVGEAHERWPLMNTDDVVGAVWSPADGRVSPSDLCAALIKGAKGGKVFENTAVTAILTKNGRIAGVTTAAGTVRCDAIAVCAGLWSQEVGALTNAQVPLWPCEHFYLLTQPMAEVCGNLPTLSDHDSHLYIRDDSGGLLIGCFEAKGKAINPKYLGDNFAFQLLPEDWNHFEPMMQHALKRIPLLEKAEIKMLLNGPESFTPDGMFMLGETAETQGLFLGCGMNSVGIATGGGAGHALAHCIVHGYLPAALPEADPKRFPACFNSASALAIRVPEILGKHYEIGFPNMQPTTARNLRLLPTTALWKEHNAHFGQFYGWERPLYFNKTQEPTNTFAYPDWHLQVQHEVQQAHEKVALFDLSTLGKIEVQGADAESFLNRLCTALMTREAGRVIYTAMLNERGGIESDFTALRLKNDCYYLYTATSAIKRDLVWLSRHKRKNEQVSIKDITEEWAVFAIAGAQTPQLAIKLEAKEWNDINLFCHIDSKLADKKVRVARLSYVGESGWEISCRSTDAKQVASTLLNAGATPAGLFAQSAMRIEKRFLAYGHDIDADTTPITAGLKINWDKEFIGKKALLTQTTPENKKQLVSLVAKSSNYPNQANLLMLGNEPVYADDKIIGQTTSAAYGYRIGKQVAIAWVMVADLCASNIRVNIGGEFLPVNIIQTAAFDPQGKRVRRLNL